MVTRNPLQHPPRYASAGLLAGGLLLTGTAVGALAYAATAQPKQPATAAGESVALDDRSGIEAGGGTARSTTTRPESPTDPVAVELIEGPDATPPVVGLARPELGEVYLDPVYGTALRRLSSAEGTRFDRNTYSRRQAENADGTMFFTYHGDAEYRVYDRETLDLVVILPVHPDGEPQWHPSDPNSIRHLTGANSSVGDFRILEYDLATGRTTVLADLADRIVAEYPSADYMKDNAEGSPSADGSRMAWIVYDASEDPIAVVSYDLATDTILGLEDLDDLRPDGSTELDWVSMAPSGSHVVAGFWESTIVYDADLNDPRALNQKADHSDIAVAANGNDTYVYIDFSAGPDAGWLMAVDLVTLERTRLIDYYDDTNTSLHISGKAFDAPGWVVVSSYNCKEPGAWTCDKVMLVELDTDPDIYSLAHTYNCGDNYWTETHAVANRDLTRVYFNSDAGSCGIDAEVYEISVPGGPWS